MGKLKTLPPRLSTLPPRLGPSTREEAVKQYEATRNQRDKWRAWYKTARWQRLREAVLLRDLYTCQQTGVLLSGKYPDDNAPVVDHKVPHRGDPDLFWDIDNLQAVSRRWHDTIKHAMEMGGKATPHPDWFSPSLVPLTIVCGPPASGKSTYVRQHAGPDDLVIDVDMIASEMAGTHTHGWNRDKFLNPAIYRRNDLIGQLGKHKRWPAAWLIVGEPRSRWRDWWERKLKPVRIVVIETPERVCLERVAADPQRPSADNAEGIVRWWTEYDPRAGDEVIRP